MRPMFEGMQVVLTTGSMNRLEPLRRSLATWLDLAEVDMFIIVDWGSTEPLRDALSDFKDSRLNILRVEGEQYWLNAKCHNLELRMASNAGLLFRVDGDTLVSRDFFSSHPRDPRGFYALDWRTVPKDQDEKRNLAGTLLIEPKYLLVVNGYNERLIHYGKEDDDLYDRLVGAGLRMNKIDLSKVDHIPHSDEARFENLEVASAIRQAPDIEGGPSKRNVLTLLSKKIAEEQPWTIFDRMTTWRVTRVDSNYWTCRAVTTSVATAAPSELHVHVERNG